MPTFTPASASEAPNASVVITDAARAIFDSDFMFILSSRIGNRAGHRIEEDERRPLNRP
jgi:hypothetical protein